MIGVGKWIIHDLGALKVKAFNGALRKSLIKRLSTKLPNNFGYSAWMSSSFFAKDFLSQSQNISLVKAAGVLDFSPEFLSSLHNIISRSVANFDIDPNHIRKINCEILELDRESCSIFEQAYQMIDFWPPWLKNIFCDVIAHVVPINRTDGKRLDGAAFSDHNLIGAIFASVEYSSPFPELALNISYAHELGHNVLMIYQYSQNLIIEGEKWVYSGVRKTERPVVMALHAAIALAFMLECIECLKLNFKRQDEKIYLDGLLTEYKLGMKQGLEALEGVKMNDLGNQIIQDLRLYL